MLREAAGGGLGAVSQLCVRRFRCEKPVCRAVAFAEQITGLTTPHGERFQRCPSRVGTALVMMLIRLGLMRDLREMCKDFNRAMPHATGARVVDRARFLVRSVRVSSSVGRAARGSGDPVACTDVGHVGEDRDTLGPQIRRILWVRAAVRPWVRPGSAGNSHGITPAGSVTTCTFTPCRLCFLTGPLREGDPTAPRPGLVLRPGDELLLVLHSADEQAIHAAFQ